MLKLRNSYRCSIVTEITLTSIKTIDFEEYMVYYNYEKFYRNALLYLLLFSALNYCYLNGLSSS